MTAVGIRHAHRGAAVPARLGSETTVAVRARRHAPWWQWLAAMAVVAPGGGYAMHLATSAGEQRADRARDEARRSL